MFLKNSTMAPHLPLRMLDAGGVANVALMGLEGVAGTEGLAADDASPRSASLPRLLDGRRSFCRTASSCRRSDTQQRGADLSRCKSEGTKW